MLLIANFITMIAWLSLAKNNFDPYSAGVDSIKNFAVITLYMRYKNFSFKAVKHDMNIDSMQRTLVYAVSLNRGPLFATVGFLCSQFCCCEFIFDNNSETEMPLHVLSFLNQHWHHICIWNFSPWEIIQGPIYPAQFIICLLTTWRSKEQRHQQPWYWLNFFTINILVLPP